MLVDRGHLLLYRVSAQPLEEKMGGCFPDGHTARKPARAKGGSGAGHDLGW
jgi:hypothetical protein